MNFCKHNCGKCYLIQTKRALETRIKKHQKNHKALSHIVFNIHKLDDNYKFDWNHGKILDKEQNLFIRNLS